MVAASVLYLSFLALVLAKPARRSFVVHDQRDSAPQGFVQVGPAPADSIINLRLGLFSNDISGLEDVLYAVSTPKSAQYGQYLSKDEVIINYTLIC